MSAEPESVKHLVGQMLAAQANGKPSVEDVDKETVLTIYANFRWSLKKLGMLGQPTYADIDALLDAAIKRTRKQVRDPVIMGKALLKYAQAKTKLSEWTEDEEKRKDVCPKCQLPRFICACVTE